MCKQDIEIGRKTAVRQVAVLVPGGSAVRLLTPRPDRLSVGIVAMDAGGASAGQPLMIQTAGGTPGPIFAAMLTAPPVLLLHVTEWGQLVFGELWAYNQAFADVTAYVTELYLTESLKEV